MTSERFSDWCVRLGICALLTSCSQGCDSTKASHDIESEQALDSTRTNDSSRKQSTRFDFGPILQDPSGRLGHTFLYENRGRAILKIKQFTNGKPCCGEAVTVEPRDLKPGESIELRVLIKPAVLGKLSHWAALEFEGGEDRNVVFWTLAEVVAKIQLEPGPSAEETSPSPIRQPLSRQFTVRLIGDPADTRSPNVDFGELKVEVSIPNARVEWDGGEVKSNVGDRLVELRRSFRVTFDSGEVPGKHNGNLSLRGPGSEHLLTHYFHWEVESWVKSTPPAIVVVGSDGVETKDVNIEARDGRDFDLKAASIVEGDGMVLSAAPARKSVHSIRLEVDKRALKKGLKKTELVVETSVEEQPTLRIPIYILTPDRRR